MLDWVKLNSANSSNLTNSIENRNKNHDCVGISWNPFQRQLDKNWTEINFKIFGKSSVLSFHPPLLLHHRSTSGCRRLKMTPSSCTPNFA